MTPCLLCCLFRQHYKICNAVRNLFKLKARGLSPMPSINLFKGLHFFFFFLQRNYLLDSSDKSQGTATSMQKSTRKKIIQPKQMRRANEICVCHVVTQGSNVFLNHSPPKAIKRAEGSSCAARYLLFASLKANGISEAHMPSSRIPDSKKEPRPHLLQLICIES